MAYIVAPPITLWQLWRLHKPECRGIGSIIADAREGRLPGVKPTKFGFDVIDRRAALAAMLRA